MRFRLAHAAFAATFLLLGCRSLQAQSYPSGFTISCPPVSELKNQTYVDEHPRGNHRIVVQTIKLSGDNTLPDSEECDLEAATNRQTAASSPEAVTDEVVERVRAAWQDRGYFKAAVTGKAQVLSSDPDAQRVSVEVHVNEGHLYRLREISFRNNAKITDLALLRSVFPIEDGEVFSRERIATGLEMLRRTYLESGYVNFTGVPVTLADDDARRISLEIEIDEGQQFHLGTFEIVGLDDATRQEVLKDAPTGQIYNPELLDRFLAKHSAVFKLRPDDPRLVQKRLDVKSNTVSITLYACPCPSC